MCKGHSPKSGNKKLETALIQLCWVINSLIVNDLVLEIELSYQVHAGSKLKPYYHIGN